MGNLWHDLTKWLEDASNVVGREAGDLTLKGRLKLEIFELQRKLREHYVMLGAIAYDEFFTKKKENWHKSKKCMKTVRQIRAKIRALDKKEKEYKKVGKKSKGTKKK
jgi:hypothetical protein